MDRQYSSEPYKRIAVERGGTFGIPGEGCLVCGYFWKFHYNPAVFELVDTVSECPDNVHPGQSCKVANLFRAMRRGTHQIRGVFAGSGSDQGLSRVWSAQVR